MRRLCLLTAATLALVGAARAQSFTHDTGQIRFQVFGNGSVGAQAGSGVGLQLLGYPPALYDGRLLVGTGPDRLSGGAYASSDWQTIEPVTVLEGGLQRTRAVFSDAGAPNPLGVTVTQTSTTVYNPVSPLGRAVFLRYVVRNTSAEALSGLHIGLFSDFDVSDNYSTNQSLFYTPSNLLYTYGPTGQNGQAAGVVLLGDEPVSGFRGVIPQGGPVSDAFLFEAMTTRGATTSPIGDQISVIGAGPYDVAAGDSVAVEFAYVTGASGFDAFEAAYAARRQYPPDLTGRSQTHDTGTAALRIFDNGLVGAATDTPDGTSFSVYGESALYEGQLLVALGASQVSGAPYTSAFDGHRRSTAEWSRGTPPAQITPPAPFTTAYETSFTDGGPNNLAPAGLSVVQRSYSRPGDGFVVLEYDVTSATTRSGVYVGMFADYDISDVGATDRGAFDAATRTVYAYNAGAGGNRNYYGVSLLGRPQSGWNVSVSTVSDNGLYTGLTINGTPATTNGDRRLTIGAGPFTLQAGVPQTVRFAYVGGATLADLTANAAAAQGVFPVSSEGAPEAAVLSLAPVSPHPVSESATLEFSVGRPAEVRLTVYDVLGREVVRLADGPYAPGSHRVRLDASALAPGLYTCRLTDGTNAVTQRLIVVR